MTQNIMQIEAVGNTLKDFSFHRSGGACPVRITGYSLMQAVICNFRAILTDYHLSEMVGEYHIIVRNADGILGGKGGYEVLITYKYKTTTIWVEKIKDYEVEEQAVVFNYNQQRIITDSLHKYV